MKLVKPLGLIIATSLMVTACAGTDRTYGAAPGIEIAQLDSLPEPDRMQTYTLGAQEKLEIIVAGAEPLSGSYLTDAQGNLDFPLLGKVAVGGLDPSDAAQLIANGLRDQYLRDPQVRIIPAALPTNTISIGGQVAQPGSYPASDRLTLLRAVNLAGGLGEYAKLDDVLIMRTVEGQRYIGVYNIGAIQRGNYDDPLIYPDDIVMVGDSPARRRVDTIIGLSGLLSSSAVILNQVLQ